ELGRRLTGIGGAAAARGIRLLRQDPPSSWPASDRSANRLALARALLASGDRRGGQAALAAVAEDGSPADFAARLVRADLALEEIRARRNGPLTASDPLLGAAERPFLGLTVPPAPLSVRAEARERLIRLAAEAEDFDDGLEHARALVAASPGTVAGFEPLWKLGWAKYRARDFADARRRFETLAGLYRDSSRERRLLYWRARCVDQEGRSADAAPLYESLAGASPADVYALFARRRISGYRRRNEPAVVDPSKETAAFRRTEELLRLRLFEEAAAEARALPSSRGRDLRLAEAEFALGRFAPAAAAVKRAFPEIGTAEEARVPDPWRRLYYPIEVGGFLGSNAAQFRLDPAILRGLVRQESVFDSGARSRAGALGLTQLMPATARGLSKSVLRVRYRRAFLYDPSVNSKLGAAYLKSLFDRFSGNPLWALAAYNGGPTRMARVLRENPGVPEDEVFESHPAYETRDYVRRVMLFAESYRELYPGTQAAASIGATRDADSR
nr:transglycosylase SLT domain-containing protein [Acidobacteriota bacterium]